MPEQGGDGEEVRQQRVDARLSEKKQIEACEKPCSIGARPQAIIYRSTAKLQAPHARRARIVASSTHTLRTLMHLKACDFICSSLVGGSVPAVGLAYYLNSITGDGHGPLQYQTTTSV